MCFKEQYYLKQNLFRELVRMKLFKISRSLQIPCKRFVQHRTACQVGNGSIIMGYNNLQALLRQQFWLANCKMCSSSSFGLCSIQTFSQLLGFNPRNSHYFRVKVVKNLHNKGGQELYIMHFTMHNECTTKRLLEISDLCLLHSHP